MSDLLILSEADVRRALPMRETVEAMRTAFAALASGEASVPVRTYVSLPNGVALAMPGAWGDVAGLKWATVHPENAARGLPVVGAFVLLSDAQTGAPLALLAATALTAIRTGAGSGLATDLLASPEASVCAVIGAGVQAETQLEAVCAVRDITRALVVGRSPDRAAAFAARMSDRLGISVEVAPRQRLTEADVICTATGSPTPILASGDVSPGTHINAVGAHHPETAEIDADLVRRATVVVDHRATCAAEAGDLLLAGLDVGTLAELGEVCRDGAPEANPASGDGVTLFKSVGNAVQDLAAASLALGVARREGLGTVVPL